MGRQEARESEHTEGATPGPVTSSAANAQRYVAVGELICGKYLVEGVLGVGGMAFVLAARHIDLDQLFAIKFLNAEFLAEKTIVERFMREAKAACQVRNEHVARVHDVGWHEGAPFLVMEHLTGRDLSTLLAEGGPLPIEAAAEYAIQACEALASAHALGIVHRDVKPENLFLLDREGPPTIKLLDFGISKGAVEIGASKLTGRLSLGTPHYMSPEQIRSTTTADHRSDLWSLGAVLYELLTGELAFPGNNVTELCAAVLEAEPAPLTQYRPDLPFGLCDVVLKCLRKAPAERWENVAELACALLPFAPHRSMVSAERSSSVMKRFSMSVPTSVGLVTGVFASARAPHLAADASASLRLATPVPTAKATPAPIAAHTPSAVAISPARGRARRWPVRVGLGTLALAMLTGAGLRFAAKPTSTPATLAFEGQPPMTLTASTNAPLNPIDARQVLDAPQDALSATARAATARSTPPPPDAKRTAPNHAPVGRAATPPRSQGAISPPATASLPSGSPVVFAEPSAAPSADRARVDLGY
jgi:serine/threonine-protein kinase